MLMLDVVNSITAVLIWISNTEQNPNAGLSVDIYPVADTAFFSSILVNRISGLQGLHVNSKRVVHILKD